MTRRAIAASLLLTFTAMLSIGCGDGSGSGEFVDFRDTRPADSQSNSGDSGNAPHNEEASSGSENQATGESNSTAAASDSGVLPSSELADTLAVTTASNPTDDGAAAASPSDAAIPGLVDSATDSGGNATASEASAGSSLVGEGTEGQGLSPDVVDLLAQRAALLGEGPLVDNATPAQPLPIQLLIPQKAFRRERGSEAVRVSYDDIDLLKVLNMEPVPVDAVSHFPDWLRQLDGTLVRIRGFMFPTFQASGIERFTMARDNGICCFVRKPKIYDIIAIELADGRTTDYIEGRPFDVEGVFHIEPEADETELFRLYRIDNARVLR